MVVDGFYGERPETQGMSSDAIIKLDNVSKAYTIWSSPSARLHGPIFGQIGQFPLLPPGTRKLFQRLSHESFRNFFALKDVSLEIRRGESFGIIGKNGSGKSTLLQILAGILTPTSGSVTVNGKVAALLELGSGFNPDFTGRENVYMNAAIRGMSAEETDARFDEIEAFADIVDFIDQPTKTYSSGMLVRLAFAVAVCVGPEILIVDEALSVGDVFFQQKCFQRIHEMLDSGTTLLFVSHDTTAVQNLCNRAILLQNGEAIFEGPPEEVASRYYASSSWKTMTGLGAPQSVPADSPAPPSRAEDGLRAQILAHNILPSAKSRHGAKHVEIVAASFANEHGLDVMSVEMLKTARINLLLRAKEFVAQPTVGIGIFDRMNNVVFASGTQQLKVGMAPMQPGEERLVTLKVEFAVQPGDYTFHLACSEPSPDGPNVGYHQDWHEGLGPVTIHYDNHRTYPFYGIARLPLEIIIHPVPPRLVQMEP
jgi:lipopolysaccharide transport system ATP-binding protein